MTFAFLVDSVPFTKATRDGETSLGGSESACLGLARALVRRGHEVHVFATRVDPDACGLDGAGLMWHPAEIFAQSNAWIEWDVVVALRQCQWFAGHVEARLRVLWNQDLLAPVNAAAVMSVAWALDRLAYVSDYHRRQWEDRQPELAPLGWVTKNGYDPTHVPTASTKDPNRIIHISRPERGLRPLLEMWPELRRQHPHAELRLCRYASMYDGEGSDVRALCQSFDALVADTQAAAGGITWLGTLAKPALYQEIAAAAVMWYPGIAEFAETSCIAAIEAQACGTPFVGSWKGALPETVPGGALIKGDADTPTYRAESIDAVLSVLRACHDNAFSYRATQRQGREHVKGYTYDAIAAEWETQIEMWFRQRYEGQKIGVLRQLLHEDDHVAAKIVANDICASAQALRHAAVGRGERSGHVINLIGHLDPEKTESGLCAMSFACRTCEAVHASRLCDRVIHGQEQGPAEYAAHSIQDPLVEVKLATRFQVVGPLFKDCTHLLDVACGNGAGAIAFALMHPHLKVTGIDYADDNITRARDAAQRAGVADRCTFERLTVYDFDKQEMHADLLAPFVACGRFDGLFVGEFVEHVADCTLLVDALELLLVDGAVVVYTCPVGPFVELAKRGDFAQKSHVHCFKHDDVKAVWGAKQDCHADFFQIGTSARGSSLGHWIIRYRHAEGHAAGARDLERRAQRTRPMPRLSVGLITKDAEQDLARCLASVWPIADEILVGDTGSSDDTVAIATKYGARVLTLPPVESHLDGFAGARNAVLAEASGEWFLWLDADEVLLEGARLRRYLDGQIFNGFVLHQTHLYIDAPPTWDIPVRLFRLWQDIQFYGCVHEQPQQGDCNTDIHPTLEPFDVRLAHTGYLTHAVRESKRVERNLPLLRRDQAVFEDRLLGKVLLLREAAIQADAERAAHQGEMTERAAVGFENTVRLFHAHFADPAHKFHKIARPFYESALQGLGIGYEMEIALAGKVGGMGSSHAAPERCWVRDGAELEAILAYKAQGMREKMANPTFKTDPDVGVTAVAEPAREEATA